MSDLNYRWPVPDDYWEEPNDERCAYCAGTGVVYTPVTVYDPELGFIPDEHEDVCPCQEAS